jgi:hypothetical protein
MSAFKDFRIFGEHSVGFRFDAFNAFNIVSYGNPDTGSRLHFWSNYASRTRSGRGAPPAVLGALQLLTDGLPRHAAAANFIACRRCFLL